MAASVTRLGSEFRVNSATANDQTAPEITALSNGGFVVTWVDASAGVGGATGDTSSTAVKAQVFGASGTQVGSEIRVNTATANAQGAPQITALSGGGFVVTWQDGSLGVGGATGDASNTAVKAQVFAAGGSLVGSEIRVNTATANAQSLPEITALSGGGFVVTWQDSSGGTGGATGDSSGLAVKAQVFGSTGSTVGSEIRVNIATANDQSVPEITALSNGGFVVTWQDRSLGVNGATGDTSGAAIKAQVFGATGTRVGSEVRVNSATANDQSAPEITALSNGGFVVTWQDGSLGVGGATRRPARRPSSALQPRMMFSLPIPRPSPMPTGSGRCTINGSATAAAVSPVSASIRRATPWAMRMWVRPCGWLSATPTAMAQWSP
jgi:hypothetical protein